MNARDRFFAELLRRRDGIYASDLLLAAVAHLDFFSVVDREPADAPGICRAFGLAARPVDVMLTLFCALGLLERDHGRLRVSARARPYLVAGGTGDLRAYFGSLRERPVCREILDVLKNDRPTSWSNDPKGDEWAKAMDESAFAESFTAAMDARGSTMAQKAAARFPRGARRLLDVAGGSGIYAAELLSRSPRLFGAILEKATVRPAIERTIERRGLAARLEIIESDMFGDPWPRGFDAHLLSHVLHDWGERDARRLIERSFESLEPGGLIALHDAHVSRAKDGPLPVAEYSVLLMVSTRGKCYSIGEMEQMLKDAGFVHVRVRPTVGFRSLITARKPPLQGTAPHAQDKKSF